MVAGGRGPAGRLLTAQHAVGGYAVAKAAADETGTIVASSEFAQWRLWAVDQLNGNNYEVDLQLNMLMLVMQWLSQQQMKQAQVWLTVSVHNGGWGLLTC